MIPSENIDEKEIFTVHRLNQTARSLLENTFQLIWIKGELSNVALPRSGHIYFTLKDTHAQVRCAMFKGSQRQLHFTPTEGMEVLLRASVSIYEERGDYQLLVTYMEKSGLGQLQQAFEVLKIKLQASGLFESSRKKSLPLYPRHIGIITSHTGAAIQDILSVLKRRYPIAPITIYHTDVQGKKAANAIVKAINFAVKHNEADVLILARGGGSLEDLWGFNEEVVALAISQCPIPIVTGIGHEIDFTIADFVADLRAPTPSAAAETISPDIAELNQYIKTLYKTIIQSMQRKLQDFQQKIDRLEKRLIHPGERLKQDHQKAKYLLQILQMHIQRRLEEARQNLVAISIRLQTINPLATLTRGYAIVTSSKTHKIIQNSNALKIGEKVNTRLGTGSFVSVVEKIEI